MSRWYKSGGALLEEISQTQLPANFAAVWYLGQASVVFKHLNTVVYVDPYFSDSLDAEGRSRRRFPPPFAAADVRDAQYVLCSHNHSDHLDLKTLAGMAAGAHPRIIVPAPHMGLLADAGLKALGARDGVPLELPGLTVVPIGCPHDEFMTDENGDHKNLGYVIKFGAISIYHSGDTVEWEGMTERLAAFNLDIACLPINGSDWKRKRRGIIGNLSAREAADIAEDAGVDLLIPTHYDLFAGNGENPAHLADYMYAYHPARKYHVMALGERLIYLNGR